MSVRRALRHRITVTQAIIGLGVFVAFLSLLANGDLIAGLGVIVLASVAVSVLGVVQRRRHPARTQRLEESALLPYTCERVWTLVKPAEKAPVIEPSIRRGYQVPGTPEGLGERQALEAYDGTTVIVEVVEYEANRRAVSRQVSPTVTEGMRIIHVVEPVDGGCRYSEGIEIDLQPARRIPSDWELQWRSETQERIARIRAVLDSEEQPSTSMTPPLQADSQAPPPDETHLG